jgi:hypothetical protein
MADLRPAGFCESDSSRPAAHVVVAPRSARRWARVVYGTTGTHSTSVGSGLAQSFVATARATTVPRAVFGAVCWALSTSPVRRIRERRATFQFQGRPIRYLPHTFATERRAEIPLGLDFLGSLGPGVRILEVGNVLAPFGAPERTVVDLYERAPNVINEDIVAFSRGLRYDRILSISTLEHVGFDEPEPRPGKFQAALDHLLTELLDPAGAFLATVPLGYNPEVDRFVRNTSNHSVRVACLRRTSAFNEWVEVPIDEITAADVDRPFPGASAIAILSAGGGSTHSGGAS